MENVTVDDNQTLALSERAENLLLTASRWAKFLGVLSYIGAAFMVVMTIMMIAAGALIMASTPMVFPPALLGAIYVPFAVIYFFIGFYLYRFGDKCQNALVMRDADELETSIGSLKSYFLVLGILAIVAISLFVIAISVGIVVALANVA